MKTLRNKIAKNLFLPLAVVGGLVLGVNESYSQENLKLTFKQKEQGHYYLSGGEDFELMAPARVKAIDNNQDSVIDEYVIFDSDGWDGIRQTTLKDEDFDGELDSARMLVYKKNENIIIKESFSPKGPFPEDEFDELSEVLKKEGTFYFKCGKDYFKEDLLSYLK